MLANKTAAEQILDEMKKMKFPDDSIAYAKEQLDKENIDFAMKLIDTIMTLKISDEVIKNE